MEKTEQADAQTPMTIQDAATDVHISDATNTFMQKKILVQLSWSECFQGQWSTPQVSGFTNLNEERVDADFDSSTIPIYATPLPRTVKSDGVKINFGTQIKRSFYFFSKNVPPVSNPLMEVEELPYNLTDQGPTKFKGSDTLAVNHVAEIEIKDDQISQTSGLILVYRTCFFVFGCSSSNCVILYYWSGNSKEDFLQKSKILGSENRIKSNFSNKFIYYCR